VRCIFEYDAKPAQPALRIIAHGAPRRRLHKAVLAQYRKELWNTAKAINPATPIRDQIELWVTFINPTSPDLDNLLTALFQALDGKVRSRADGPRR
jgi:Holliday junction resolvase RusA-like endonuclease